MTFDDAFDALIGHEGGYSNNSADPGGETRFGVTRRVAIQEGYTGDMRILPRDFAKQVYRKRYWDAVRAEQLPNLIRFSVFDAAVNSGVSQAAKWLQRALGVDDDGVIGPMTLKAAENCAPLDVAIRINCMRLEFMTDLPQWGSFSRGWVRRVVKNLKGLVC